MGKSTAALPLSDDHLSELKDESGIDEKVIQARGYETETTKATLRRLGFSSGQGGEGPWLKIPMYGPGSGAPDTVQIKPATPRPGKSGKPVKYESPRGAGVVLDVNPEMQGKLSDATQPLWITEGVKKGDAIASRGEAAVSLTGVWGWKMGSLPHEDWGTIALDGREVYLAFDSDALDKASVWDALDALVTWLERRKAKPNVVMLPKLKGLGKTGIDDYLAAGHSLDDARQYVVKSLPTRPDEDRPGMTYRLDTGDVVELTNFTARIVKEFIIDDGVEEKREFKIRAETAQGTHEFRLPAEDFNSMEWPTTHIGATAIIYAFPGAKDKTREAILLESSNVDTETVYRHTGWRKINGENHYLHAEGAIASTGLVTDVSVDLGLGGRFQDIKIPDPPALKTEKKRVLENSFALAATATGVMPLRAYLSTFRATLGGVPYAVWIYGRTGAGKSTIATLLQSHWGKAHEEHRPLASWEDTENALEEVGFRLKDMILLVDDWRPKGRYRDREERKADRVIRSQANAVGRARMTRSLKIREGRDVRATIVSTGEDLPTGEPSLTARLLQVALSDTQKETTERFKRMTLLQGYGRRGDLAKAMGVWLTWLAPRLEDVRAAHAAGVEKARDLFSATRTHARMTMMDADLYAFAQLFFSFLKSQGVMSDTDVKDYLTLLEQELKDQSLTQEELVREHAEASTILDAIRVGVRNDEARIEGMTDVVSGLGDWIGWKEGSIIYLSLTSLKPVLKRIIGYAPASRVIIKAIEDAKLVADHASSQERNVIVKRYEGKAVRVLPCTDSLLDEGDIDEEEDSDE